MPPAQQVPHQPGPEELLGLYISPASLSSFKDLYDLAVEILEKWEKRKERILATVKRLASRPEAPSWWDDAADIVDDAHRAGLRYWLLQVYYFADVPAVRTAEDLKWWCLLMFRVLDIVDHAKVVKTWGEVVQEPDPDDDMRPALGVEIVGDYRLLEEVAGAFPDKVLDARGRGEFDFSRWLRFDDTQGFSDPDWVHPSPDVFLTPGRCQTIAELAWKHLRPLAHSLGCIYPSEPSHVRGVRELRSALDEVLNWAVKEMERHPVQPTSKAGRRSEPPAANTGSKSKEQNQREAIAELLLDEFKGSSINLSQIAKRIGVPRSTLYGWSGFMDCHERILKNGESRRRARPKGYRTQDGRVEAESHDD